MKHFEGYSPIIYWDAAGYPTIGFGHLIKPGEKIEEPLLGVAAEVAHWCFENPLQALDFSRLSLDK